MGVHMTCEQSVSGEGEYSDENEYSGGDCYSKEEAALYSKVVDLVGTIDRRITEDPDLTDGAYEDNPEVPSIEQLVGSLLDGVNKVVRITHLELGEKVFVSREYNKDGKLGYVLDDLASVVSVFMEELDKRNAIEV